MIIRNTKYHFGLISILLHWIMAILLIGLLVLGIYMVNLPISLQKLKMYGWHKEYGLLALALVIVRILWRWINITPELSLPLLEKIAARSVHYTFYVLMFALPVSGWIITSAAGLPASFFGLFVLPTLVAPNEETRILFQEIHRWVGYGLIAIIVLHVSAALKHHFINKDDILRRML
jgi:cytochrome b561